MIATETKNYGSDGFTMEMVVDIMLQVERSTVKEACEYLMELGYGDTFYYEAAAKTAEEFLADSVSYGVEDHLAENVIDVTFQGGPEGKRWVTLNLQCLLEDHVAQCICVYGGEMVARTLGVYS